MTRPLLQIDRPALARDLAAVLLGGPWTLRGRAERLRDHIGGRTLTIRKWLLRELAPACDRPYPPGEETLARAILDTASFGRLCGALRRRNALPPVVIAPPVFTPAPAFAEAAVPALSTPADLAAWLGLSTDELTWFADIHDRLSGPGMDARRHYRARWVAKRSGGARLIEAPLPRLKALQRQILHGILDHARPHPAAHGFVAGRNCIDAAAQHAGEAVVVTADLEDFFTSVHAKRVHAIFRCLGYPAAVARHLTGLVTVRSSAAVIAAQSDLPWLTRRRLDHPHLPQGAPTSPALANLAAFHLDRRLQGLTARRGGRYTRYADDLAFSGDRRMFFEGGTPFIEILGEIAAEEGFRLNPSKTRLMRRGTRQRVTGLVVNRHVNVPRAEYDRLKAILTNCTRHGAASQNREAHPAFRAHLLGRIAWIAATNPARGRRLYALFDRIDWDRS